MRTLETTSLHRGVPGARHTFLPLPPGQDKLEALLQVGGWVVGCGVGGWLGGLLSCGVGASVV